MNTPSSTSHARFAAFLGLDWCDGKHDICLQRAGSDEREMLQLEHRPEAISEWARQLRERFDGQPVALALELAKGPIVYRLTTNPSTERTQASRITIAEGNRRGTSP
jgi:hypothetical protein